MHSRSARGLALDHLGRRSGVESIPKGNVMANKDQRPTRKRRRTRRVERSGRQWLVALLARTLASIVVMVVARLLGLTTSGGH
jgi:hypothetical protein